MNWALAKTIWWLFVALGNFGIAIFGVVLVIRGKTIEGLLWVLVANTNLSGRSRE